MAGEGGGINLNNPPKFYIVMLALVCITMLLITKTIEPEAGLGLLGLIVGYGVGNGIAARNNEPIEPIIGHGHREPEPGREEAPPPQG